MIAFLSVVAALAPAALAARPLRLASGSSPVPGPSDTPASSPNWNAYVLQKYPTNTFKSISASFQVPDPRAPANWKDYPINQIYSSSIWLGIDGAESDSQAAIAAMGIDMQINLDADLPLSHTVWAEFYPSKGKQSFGGVSPGDIVTLSITATNATTAVFKYENFFENISFSKTITSTVPLARKNVEFVVSPTDGNPLADYRTIDFRRVQFGLLNGTTLGPQLTDHTKYVMLVNETGQQITGAGATIAEGVSLWSNFGSQYGCP